MPWRLEIAEMRRVKAGKGSRRPEAHEPGKGPKEQNSTFPLEGTHATNQPAKARTVSTDSNGNVAHHQIARHVTAWSFHIPHEMPALRACRRMSALEVEQSCRPPALPTYSQIKKSQEKIKIRLARWPVGFHHRGK